VVFNAAAPDDGNMQVLERIGTPEQKERWLQPIVRGDVRSAFAMTEPHPGGGSDPSMIQTRAESAATPTWSAAQSGSSPARARRRISSSSPARRTIRATGLTAFLFHRDQPGWRILRRIPIMGPEEHGGHCELEFDGLEIPAENVLWAKGRGSRSRRSASDPRASPIACAGSGSQRCVEIARAYAAERHGFGVRLADRESIQLMLGRLP
jgi:acyl-CoA dehydrogenase